MKRGSFSFVDLTSTSKRLCYKGKVKFSLCTAWTYMEGEDAIPLILNLDIR